MFSCTFSGGRSCWASLVASSKRPCPINASACSNAARALAKPTYEALRKTTGWQHWTIYAALSTMTADAELGNTADARRLLAELDQHTAREAHLQTALQDTQAQMVRLKQKLVDMAADSVGAEHEALAIAQARAHLATLLHDKLVQEFK